MRFGSFASEPVERLFRGHFRHEDQPVHERMEYDTARSEDEYWQKLARYAVLWATERAAKGKSAAAGRASAAAFAYLLENLVLRLGVLDGPRTWRFHRLHARYAALKYLKLRAMSAQPSG